MVSELSFLLDLLLNHKLPKSTRDVVAGRIKDVEGKLTVPSAVHTSPLPPLPVQRPQRQRAAQSPSTMAILAEKFTPDELEKMNAGESIASIQEEQPLPITPPQPVTPAAAQALQQRQAAIMKAVNAGPFGAKPETGSNSPRKW